MHSARAAISIWRAKVSVGVCECMSDNARVSEIDRGGRIAGGILFPSLFLYLSPDSRRLSARAFLPIETNRGNFFSLDFVSVSLLFSHCIPSSLRSPDKTNSINELVRCNLLPADCKRTSLKLLLSLLLLLLAV